jgi:hypothetical protein
MKKKIELLFFMLAITCGLSGVLLADITSVTADISSLDEYANEYRVDADQPENTNNCTMNSMEGSQAPDTPLEDPNTWEVHAPVPFVEDVWRPSALASNDAPIIPTPPYYPDVPNPSPDTPEPATVLVICAGMCGILSLTRRKRSKNITK